MKQMWGDWDEPEWLRYFGLDAGDVDRDGYLDIISGRYIYHNPGSDMEGKWSRTVLPDNVDAILFMNVDNDPFADIIAQALPNLYWYEAVNKEGTRYKRQKIGEVPATSHVNSQGFEKAQIVEGGNEEILIAGNGDIYSISIPQENSWSINKIAANTSDEGIGTGDIDGDGDIDIAAGRRPDGEDEPTILVWFENPGNTNQPWQDVTVGTTEHPIDRVQIADVNNDGKMDIIITEERYPGLEPDASLYIFTQENPSTWKRVRLVEQYSMNNLDVMDIDKDGDQDIVTNEHKGDKLELQLWLNDGSGNFTKRLLDTGKENHLGTQLADLDGDGDLDIYGAGWDHYQFMHVWRNDTVRPVQYGQRFKEYSWIPDSTMDEGKFLRVGGKFDYSKNGNYDNGRIPLNHDVDLKNAVHAELIVERVQSHEDTKNLELQFNDNAFHRIPEPSTIPARATDYMFHSVMRTSIPLSDLKSGNGNTFRFRVDEDQAWGWPQNLIYGITLRIYYPDKKNGLSTLFRTIEDGQSISEHISLSVDTEKTSGIKKVDYIGLLYDADQDGDGVYYDWQYHYLRGKLTGHIGQSSEPPFRIKWKTEWIPDQTKTVKIAARVTGEDGFITIYPVAKSLTLDRDYSVELLKPYNQPAYWVTRNDEYTSNLYLSSNPETITKARMVWRSWSPCYSEGIRINGNLKEPVAGQPCYDQYWHNEPIEDVSILENGENTLTTLKTPLHDGQMVHGMEVQWPGIMLKVKSSEISDDGVQISETSYMGDPHFIIHTERAIYYYDKEGGGFSRIIDKDGNDWISFKKEPWNEYPASAASSYRGIPNLVFGSDDSGAGHPGFEKTTSEQNGERRITTTSNSNKWKWEWIFFDNYAVMKVLETDPNHPYWFLYEGIPGGEYNIDQYYYGTNQKGPENTTPDLHKGFALYDDYRWAYFGDKGVDRVFVVGQVEKDQLTDMFAYLGNTESGIDSNDGMTVFGFGRNANTEPLLKKKHSFVIGFIEEKILSDAGHERLSQKIETLILNQQ